MAGSGARSFIKILIMAALCYLLYHTVTTNMERVDPRDEEIQVLSDKIDSLQSVVDSLSAVEARPATSSRSTATARTAAPRQTTTAAQTSTQAQAQASATNQATAPATSGKVKISTKYKIENFYIVVEDKPKVQVGPYGTVVIGFTLNRYGQKIKIVTEREGTTITDEDVIAACKVAVMETFFSPGIEDPGQVYGTATFTFSPAR